MAKVGDKFIIEIESVCGKLNGNEFSEDEEYLRGNPRLYKIKGFNSLVLDDNGLNRLEKYEPPEEEKPSPIDVGDEVEDSSGARWFVTFLWGMTGGGHAVSGVGLDGRIHSTKVIEVKRTGRRNWHIVEALAWRPPVEML